MHFQKSRLMKLEGRHRRRVPVDHWVSIVHSPWGLDEADHARWLGTLQCHCGQRGCPELKIGALIPETAPSDVAWAERARQYQEGRPYA